MVTKKRVEIDENEINQKLNFKLKNGKTALLFERDKISTMRFLIKITVLNSRWVLFTTKL